MAADPPTRYVELSGEEWRQLAASVPMALDRRALDMRDLAALPGPLEPHLDAVEVAAAYLPLGRLLHLHAAARLGLASTTEGFVGRPVASSPFVVGLAGSVAVGKSTAACALRALLARGPGTPRVDLVTTDGFLHPNAELERRGLLGRKGFPESYDVDRLLSFLAQVKAGEAEVEAPLYSHVLYDVVPGSVRRVRRPDVLVVEGVNVLSPFGSGGLVVSDLLDFAVYLDADETDLQRWYVQRFLARCATVFQDPASHFHRYAGLGQDEASAVAVDIWASVNAVNLREYILPTRERADIILEKGPDHRVRRARLRPP